MTDECIFTTIIPLTSSFSTETSFSSKSRLIISENIKREKRKYSYFFQVLSTRDARKVNLFCYTKTRTCKNRVSETGMIRVEILLPVCRYGLDPFSEPASFVMERFIGLVDGQNVPKFCLQTLVHRILVHNYRYGEYSLNVLLKQQQMP